MSWSFSAVGKPAAVAKKAREEKDRNKCIEPEETFRCSALDLIAANAEVLPENMIVRGGGQGSMWSSGGVVQSANIEIKVEPVYGWVE